MRREGYPSRLHCRQPFGSMRWYHGYNGKENYALSMKRFRWGLVVGKFSPLHRGHEYLIGRAIERCENVAIISYSKPEFAGCEAARRERWLAALFPGTRRLVINDETFKTV